MTERYGKGFSTTNLWYFRQFYQTYPDRLAILHPPGGELDVPQKISPSGREMQATEICHPSGGELIIRGFSPRLSWSRYRALMRVADEKGIEMRDVSA